MKVSAWLSAVISVSVHSGDSLEEVEVDAIVAGVLQESSGARNHKLSYAEFEHVVSRAPDFVNFFHITVWTAAAVPNLICTSQCELLQQYQISYVHHQN